jgi:S1-C subfamily serine protease
MTPLPIDAVLPSLTAALEAGPRAVLVAAPGAGKTTRVPLALLNARWRGDVISDVRDAEVDSLADFYRKVWTIGDAGAEVPMRIVRDGRESWLRVKSADRNSFLKRPQLQ